MRSDLWLSARLVPAILSLCLALGGSACGGDDDDRDPVGDGGGDGEDGGDDVDGGGREGGSGDDGGGEDVYVPPPEGCGDGMRVQGSEEQCDDGNNVSGDGCSARCELEEGYRCAPMGGECMPVCGDGLIVGDESCDDGNTDSADDGCTPSCTIDPGWACPTPGQLCEPALCGDGVQVGNEACDDHNGDNGDGCSNTCQVEAGWVCGGGTCTADRCGDGIVAGTEVCDDGNNNVGDGCDATCESIEPFHVCPPAGGACTKYTRCGDGVFTADEACDDGNNISGDGCSANCQAVEDGYACTGGTQCAPVCGDGKVRGTETCDVGSVSGPGCTNCQLQPGYNCPTAGQACVVEVCGNGQRRGLEQCDDGNNVPFDGCFQCQREPACPPNSPCTAVCGDGFKFPNEACDDGNTRSGDGCSATCQLEQGFSCTVVEEAPPSQIKLPIIYRDFKSHNLTNGHPDFNDATGDGSTVLVRENLGWDANNDGMPDAMPGTGPASVVYAPGGPTTTTSGAANFNQWYRSGHTRVRTVIDELTFTQVGNIYRFADRTFYPLDNRGWADPSVPAGEREAHIGNDSSASSGGCSPIQGPGDPDAGRAHNFGFTSELRFWFTFRGGENLTFIGDDDVWVFIAGRRVIDLGGVHCAETDTVRLRSDGSAHVDHNNNGTVQSGEPIIQLGLVIGNVYEVVVFQAERHVNESSYRLELGQFLARRSQCVPLCGDGIRTAGELCDDGGRCVGGANDGMSCSTHSASTCPGGTCQSLNTGAYGHCGADCRSRGPFCGDGVRQEPQEACDLGVSNNLGTYGATATSCNPDCSAAPFCGDMKLQAFAGENCDQGMLNGDNMYGVCSTSCKLGPRCGDNMVQADEGEQCDDGINKSPYGGCAPGCKLAPRCGDGMVQKSYGEQCDNGDANSNDAGYGGCNLQCKSAGFCGDGKLDAAGGEECDDGNINSYDGCSAACKVELVLF